MLRLWLGCLTLLSVSFVFDNVSMAGSITVSKTRVVIDSAGTADTIRVRNRDDRATSVQVVPIPWDGEIGISEPAKEIIAMPPVFDLPPAGEQVVRLAARGLSSESAERAYVLVIKETPTEVQTDGAGLAFSLNLRLPLFVAPKDAKPDPSWKLQDLDNGNGMLVLSNAGNSHINVKNIVLSQSGESRPLSSIEGGGYVLAGEERSWPIELNTYELSEPLSLKAETLGGHIETVLSLPDD